MAQEITASLVPMPGTCHPSFKYYDIDPKMYHVQVVTIRRLIADFTKPISLTEKFAPIFTLLTRSKCSGPAPFVGYPFSYEWYVWKDSYGRWIAEREAQPRLWSVDRVSIWMKPKQTESGLA